MNLPQRFVEQVAAYEHAGPFVVVTVTGDGPLNAHGPFLSVMEAFQASIDWEQELDDPAIELRILNLYGREE